MGSENEPWPNRTLFQLRIAFPMKIRFNSEIFLLDVEVLTLNKLSIPSLVRLIRILSCILHLFLFKSLLSELSYATVPEHSEVYVYVVTTGN